MESRDRCLAQLSLLSPEEICSVEHANWLIKNIPRAASKFINKWPQYNALNILLKTYNAKSILEALYLLSINSSCVPLCSCGKTLSFWISGKRNYPKHICGTCSKTLSQHNMMVKKDHKSAALKARDTKYKTIDTYGKNMYQQIAEKSADKKAISMAKHCAKLHCKTAGVDPSFLYAIRNREDKIIKIGRSNNPIKRIFGMQKAAKKNFEIIFIAEDTLFNIVKLEIDLHDHLAEDAILQPKNFPGRTEWFSDKIQDELNILLEDLHGSMKIHYFKGKEYVPTVSQKF